MAHEALWWKRGVVYQIYPRSFQDSDGDGIGDLRGIIQRLDYLVELGVDAIWISPFYPSPMKDFGYDISNYVDVDPVFGSLADFDALVRAAHERDLRVILDLVPNHSSDMHPWFQESRSSRQNPKRDWYLWRDPAGDGGPPNNWRSNFGGRAWTFDPATGQYFYHSFLPEQPDLNFRNPEVAAAMLDVMRFWLDRGVDGFRVDAIAHLVEDALFRDEPPARDYAPHLPEYSQLEHIYTRDLPETHAFIREMRKLCDSYAGERVVITEAYLPLAQLMTYYGSAAAAEAHLPFNFQLIHTGWQAAAIADTVGRYEASLPEGAWPNWVLGNHDRPRLASRVGEGQARVAAMLLLTLRGTPTLYYGDELGMVDIPVPPHLVQDPAELREPGKGQGRDPERSPMQWDASVNAGFTLPGARPWLPVAADASERNVEKQSDEAESMLALYRSLLALRRKEPALAIGTYRVLEATREVFAFERQSGSERLVVALNFSDAPRALKGMRQEAQLLLSTRLVSVGEQLQDGWELRPNEGVILRVGPRKVFARKNNI